LASFFAGVEINACCPCSQSVSLNVRPVSDVDFIAVTGLWPVAYEGGEIDFEDEPVLAGGER